MSLELLKLQVEELIRSGQRDQAGALLKTLKGSSIPRSQVRHIATLARRAGQLNFALHVMTPIVRPKVSLSMPALDDEKATYAIILLALGANTEALEILASCDAKNAEVCLALAFTYIHSWDYSAAIPKLKAYLRNTDGTPYQRMIANVNLAASYIALNNTNEGLPLLQEILKVTEENQWFLLYKNALEISSQASVLKNDWNGANHYLTQAINDGTKTFNLDDFFIEKWQAISNLLRDGANNTNLQSLEKIRACATRNRHWETIRDCDYYRAIAVKDSELALKLYFGTPFAAYRKRLLNQAAEWLKVPSEFHWSVDGSASERVFHLIRGEEVGNEVSLKAGTALHKGLLALTSDFYRPFSVGSLHSLIFHKEHFNPYSSPRRLSFLIHRLRAWFSDNKIPLSIIAEKGEYKLQALAPYTFIFETAPSQKTIKEANDSPANFLAILRKLKDQERDKLYSAAEIAQATELSVRSVRYFLKWAVEKNKMRKFGTGRDTRYKVR